MEVLDKNLNRMPIAPEVLAMVPIEIVRSKYVLPMDFNTQTGVLSLATCRVKDVVKDFSLLQRRLKMKHPEIQSLQIYQVDFKNFQDGYGEHFNEHISGNMNDLQLDENEREKIINEQTRKADEILDQAIELHASDIHITPMPNGTSIEYRVDGKLVEADINLTIEDEIMICNIYKRTAQLEPVNLVPQDGRFSYRGKDIRFSSSPYGSSGMRNKVVMRIIGGAEKIPTIDKLGFGEEETEQLRRLISKPNGIILVCGPTGEGKSTTLYSMLNELNKSGENIIFTLEDPIEKYIDGIAQCQVRYAENEATRLTFEKGLKSALRQDPDVIQVGEIRDGETAITSVQASQTGHLILSTLHVRNSISVFRRLKDMGASVNSFSEQIVGVCSQRLLGLNCPHCKERVISPLNKRLRPQDLEFLEDGKYSYQSKGCTQCHNTGIIGRRPVIEIIEFNNTLRDFFCEQHGLVEIEAFLRKTVNFKSLYDKGLKLVQKGDVSLKELLSVTEPDEDIEGQQ